MKIYNQSYIWDLHIHTCMCKIPSNEFKKLSIEEYVDLLLDIYKNYPDLKLISFTDHNRISYDVIKHFKMKNSNIEVIPGAEIDVFLTKKDIDNNDFKHLIFYFDTSILDDEETIIEINKFIEKKSPVLLHDLLDTLVEKSFEFMISPHFSKQDSRAIDYYWNELEVTERQSKKYLDQFFCFWETSGASSIAKAKEFISDFYLKNRISIVSFSDGNTFEKLKNFVETPTQYFNALPTFKGLKVVGTDCRRIVNDLNILTREQKSNLIGKIEFEDNTIMLSKKLNTIVGGRGSGKSVLADKIATKLDDSKREIFKNKNPKRLEYLDKKQIKIYNMNNIEILNGTFNYDYYNQGYIADLFSSSKIDMKELYFKNIFDSLKKYSKSSFISDLVTIYNGKIKEIKQVAIKDNLSSIGTKMKVVNFIKKPIKLKTVGNKYKKLSFTNYEKLKIKVFSQTIIPTEIQSNIEIIKSFDLFFNTINSEINKYNVLQINNSYLTKTIGENYDKAISTRDKDHKTKSKALILFQNKIHNFTVDTINRVNIIKTYFQLSKTFKASDFDNEVVKGFDKDTFDFIREYVIEHPLQYFFRIFDNYFDSQKTNITQADFSTKFKNAIDIYCYKPDKYLKKTKKITDMNKDLATFSELNIEINTKINYFDGENSVSLDDQSPGTKANILMEYIAFYDTKIPLIIDQPEDNVDNYTIFNKLTNWFESMKTRRQIIVVTHDANIVVNADSENIIFSRYNETKFKYSYGAFEFDNNIIDISNVLEGGKEAIERRLKKYGN